MGETERSKWAGAHESTWAVSEFQPFRSVSRKAVATSSSRSSEFGVKRLPSDLAADLWPLTSASAYSTLTTLQRKRYLFVCINRRAEENPKGCCALKDSEEVYTALKRGACRPRTRKARGASVHIELSRSMRDRRDGVSRTRSLFLRARHGRRRPGDCGWTR